MPEQERKCDRRNNIENVKRHAELSQAPSPLLSPLALRPEQGKHTDHHPGNERDDQQRQRKRAQENRKDDSEAGHQRAHDSEMEAEAVGMSCESGLV